MLNWAPQSILMLPPFWIRRTMPVAAWAKAELEK
jgi:hypothetical protein